MDAVYQADVMGAIEEWKKAAKADEEAREVRKQAEAAVTAAWRLENETSRIESEKRRRMNAIIGIPDEED